MIVAAASNARCVDRAFSIIRAVLGYDTALPDGWDKNVENRDPSNVISRGAQAFSKHQVLVWCLKENWAKCVERGHVEYMGERITSGKEWDDYLFAFVYGIEEEEYGHMVVGWPTAFGQMEISFVLAVNQKT